MPMYPQAAVIIHGMHPNTCRKCCPCIYKHWKKRVWRILIRSAVHPRGRGEQSEISARTASIIDMVAENAHISCREFLHCI